MLDLNAMHRELDNLKESYRLRMRNLADDAATHAKKDRISTHDPFNLGASVSELATLAGKIEATENVIRWMDSK